MKKSKDYRLARKFIISKDLSNPTCLTVGDCYESDSRFQGNQPNIFRRNERGNLVTIQNNGTAENSVIGMKELELYRKMKGKTRKGVYSKQPLLLFGSKSTSKPVKNATHKYLTKEQVINSRSPIAQGRNKETPNFEEYLCSDPSARPWQSVKDAWISSLQHTQNGSLTSREKFSLALLKMRMEVYKKGWRRHQTTKEKKRGKMVIKDTKDEPPSEHKFCGRIVRQVFNFDQDMSISWSESLRQGRNSSKIPRSQQIVECGGMGLLGRCKLERQKEWVEKKHEDGYCFYKAQE